MSVMVKLSGGPLADSEYTLEDLNYMAVLYPGYSPDVQETDPEYGLVVHASWTGGPVEEAAHQSLHPGETQDGPGSSDVAAQAPQDPQVASEATPAPARPQIPAPLLPPPPAQAKAPDAPQAPSAPQPPEVPQ